MGEMRNEEDKEREEKRRGGRKNMNEQKNE